MRVHALDRPRGWLGRTFGASPLGSDSSSWYKGVLGEIAVGEQLAQLGPEWRVLHSIPVGRGDSDIDHVIIGPPGVFTLNTKNHSGQAVWVAGRSFLVAGKKQRHLFNAAHEAARAAKLLSAAVGASVEVTGMIVVVRPARLTIRDKPVDVLVVTDSRLLRSLRRRRTCLNADQVCRIASVAERWDTWRSTPQRERARADQAEFEALHTQVIEARRRRLIWATVLMTLVVAAAVVMITRLGIAALLPG
nr:nuclease-related domain-containing protein [Microlunatus panaciterrae]